MIRVGVLGAGGRMGATVCRAVTDAPDLELVAAVDPRAVGGSVAGLEDVGGFPVSGSLEALSAQGAEVAIDFTVADAAVANLSWCAAHGVHAVCGTTGISGASLEVLAAAFDAADGPNAVIAPNFAISAVLLIRFAALAAPFFDTAEVIELHHDQKRDAPSGTAIETARRIDAARAAAGAGAFAADPTADAVMPGARGARTEGGTQLHSVRLRGLVAHEEVLFGTLGQSLTLRQDSYDRSSFMPGVLLATRKVPDTPGFTVGLDRLVEL